MPSNTVREIESAELAQWVNDADHKLRIIDVRQMTEIAMGTIPRAEAFPLHILPAKIHELSPAEKLVIICRSGARSAQACMFLQQQGFTNVYNLRGGVMSWMQCGLSASRQA